MILAVLLLASSCGADEQRVQAETGVETTSPSAEPTILLAGDSVMQELAWGLVAALDGSADARYVGLPDIAGNAAAPAEWQQMLVADGAPDLVVVLVGTWEAIRAAELPGDHDVYPAGVAPWLDVVTAETDVLWLGYPKPQVEESFTNEELVGYWSALPDAYPNVEFLDAGAALEQDGAFRTLLDVDGRQVLVRQIDGRHLCQDGVVLMGRVVLAELQQRFDLEPAPGWETGAWRDPVAFEEDGLCPRELGVPLAG
jgi:hypothetical protein